MSKSKKKLRIAIGLGIVFLILVGFPLISVYYLGSGIDYRKEQLEKLNELGQLEDFIALDIDNNVYKKTDIRNSILLLASSRQACEQSQTVLLQELYDKLKDQKGFQMLILGIENDLCKQFFMQYEEALYLPPSFPNKAIRRQFQKRINKEAAKSAVMLIDRENEIRNCYDISDVPTLEELITHITILLPASKD